MYKSYVLLFLIWMLRGGIARSVMFNFICFPKWLYEFAFPPAVCISSSHSIFLPTVDIVSNHCLLKIFVFKSQKQVKYSLFRKLTFLITLLLFSYSCLHFFPTTTHPPRKLTLKTKFCPYWKGQQIHSVAVSGRRKILCICFSGTELLAALTGVPWLKTTTVKRLPTRRKGRWFLVSPKTLQREPH